jgi:hypothetical protein
MSNESKESDHVPELTANSFELAVRLGLTSIQRVILAEYTVFRKGENLVRCPDHKGHIVTVKARHTRVCERCGISIFAYEPGRPIVCHDCVSNG